VKKEKVELTKNQIRIIESLRSKIEEGYEKSLREQENESCYMDYAKL
jgi:hypothetical protein